MKSPPPIFSQALAGIEPRPKCPFRAGIYKVNMHIPMSLLSVVPLTEKVIQREEWYMGRYKSKKIMFCKIEDWIFY